MSSSQHLKTLCRLCILSILTACLWLFSGKAYQNTAQFDEQIQVTINQLQPENGVPPVEIRCDSAHLNAPNSLQGFSCTLKNNTDKNITAVNLTYSILLDTNGIAGKDTHSLTIETLVHPDFAETSHPIAPGTEQTVRSIGKVSYDNSSIKGIEVGIDYVEFKEGAAIGPNLTGSKIITDMREGARKYKGWVTQKYVHQGKSISAVASLLQTDQPLPNASGELVFKNSDEENGARAYRTRLRKIRDTKGSAAMEKYLQK